jgi:hypothetical protein
VVAVRQTQIRCGECNRRLGDFVNEVRAGQVILENREMDMRFWVEKAEVEMRRLV